MSYSSVKLTKRVIDAASPGAARRIIWDTELRGFGVRVETSGTKSFLIRYRPKGNGRNGSKRFVTIGRYGAMTPEQARNEARSKLAAVARGDDPAEARDQAKEAPTLSQLIERFLSEQVTVKKKASTAALYTHYLIGLVIPTLGSKKAGSVSHGDIAKLHGAIGKTRPVTANRVIATLSGLFSYGAEIGELPHEFNPAKGIEPYKERPRQRYLNTVELARLADALHEAETIGLAWHADETKATAKHSPTQENRRRKLDPYAIAAIRLLLLTGARLREVLHARWDWFDLSAACSSCQTPKPTKSRFISVLPPLDPERAAPHTWEPAYISRRGKEQRRRGQTARRSEETMGGRHQSRWASGSPHP